MEKALTTPPITSDEIIEKHKILRGQLIKEFVKDGVLKKTVIEVPNSELKVHIKYSYNPINSSPYLSVNLMYLDDESNSYERVFVSEYPQDLPQNIQDILAFDGYGLYGKTTHLENITYLASKMSSREVKEEKKIVLKTINDDKVPFFDVASIGTAVIQDLIFAMHKDSTVDPLVFNEIVEVPKQKDSHIYSPNYTIAGLKLNVLFLVSLSILSSVNSICSEEKLSLYICFTLLVASLPSKLNAFITLPFFLSITSNLIIVYNFKFVLTFFYY